MKRIFMNTIRAYTAAFVVFQLTFGLPLTAFAQGEDQGIGQGENQGANQGESQGLNQGAAEESSSNADVSASNTNTGSDSTNTNTVSTTDTDSTTVNNSSDDTTDITGDVSTGENTNSQNTGNTGITTGNANAGVTQVKSDNTAVKDGNVLLSNTAQKGDVTGDLVIGVNGASSLVGEDGKVKSVQATNSSTGSNSDNSVDISTTTNEITEVQNDGIINNNVTLSVATGDNHADQNTGNADVTTGNANASASLVNLLNTTVENGNILVSTTDVYGDVQGDIRLPDFNQLATILTGSGPIAVDATNTNTGSNSNNTIDVTVNDTNNTTVNSTATVDTTITADAITGQNDSLENTGGAAITTGDASIQASNVSLTNTTVKDASLGIVIVNALNRFIGFLIGSDNVATPLSEEETLTYVNAQNKNTGSDSDNTISVTNNNTETTNITNDATITNNIDASANTGRNTTNKNTGKGTIATGDANVAASAVNVANTTVKNGNLAVYIINIFGNFLGNVFFGDTELALPYDTSSNIAVNAENSNTGEDSTNQINVHVSRTDNTELHNSSTLRSTFDTTIDTGNNRANRNTNGADITTGTSELNILSRSIANTTALGSPWGNSNINFNGTNDTTGESSTNTTNLDVTENFTVGITNLASVENFIPGSANTGNNQLDQNTIGGSIVTGLIDFNLSIGNILNRIFLALNPSNTTLVATTQNMTTGADSTNTNTVSFARNFLLSLFNTATANTLIDFLFNTGGNTANQNTLGAAITTGPICGNGTVENNLNTVTGGSSFNSTTAANAANANTTILALANTGDNTLQENTVGSSAIQNQDCPPEPSPLPSPTTTPTPTPPPGDNGGGGNNGGDGGTGSNGGSGDNGGGNVAGTSDNGSEKIAQAEPSNDRVPRIAGVVERVLKGVGGLGLGSLQKPSTTPTEFPIAPFFVGSLATVVSAAWADHKARRNKRYLTSL